jgi:phage-related tail fiber protein
MAVKYKTRITTAGAAKFAAAAAGGTKVTITHMAVGDGGGTLPEPNVNQTKLIGEKWRAALNKITVDAKKKNYVIAELVIPPEIGGFWLREMGLYDAAGTLVAVANMAESYKPELAEGSGRAQTVRMVIIISALEAVDLTVDTTTVMATQEYVDDKIAEHEQSRRHPDATLAAKGLTQLSSATDSISEALAATPKAVKAAYDMGDVANKNADARLAKANNLSDVTDKAAARKNIDLKGAALLDVGTGAGTVAAGNDSRIVNALQKGNNLSDVADKASARNNIGLKTAAVADVQTSKDDITAGRVLTNGGALALRTISARANPTSGDVADADDLPANSVSFVYSTADNSPDITASVLSYSGFSGGYSTQIAAEYSNGGKTIKYRTHNGDTAKGWNPWYRIYHSGDKPTAADTESVSLNGDTMTGALNVKFDGPAIQIRPQRANSAAYLLGQDFSGSRHWFVGAGDADANVNFSNYLGGGNNVTLRGDGSINIVATNGKNINLYGQAIPTKYDNFDARYQPKGSYTPAGQAYTKAESDARYIRDVRLGTEASGVLGNPNPFRVPAGCVMTGWYTEGSNPGGDTIYYKPVQKNLNGTWVNVTG